MSNCIPGSIDPYKLAKSGQTLQGKVAVASLPRVCNSLSANDGEVEYSLAFSIDSEGYCVITGDLDTSLQLRCQRCMRDFVTKVQSSFTISPVVDNKAANSLPDSYEPVMLVEDKLYPAELVEDELILAMPIVPKHQDGESDCIEVEGNIVADLKQEPANPFRVLQGLKVEVKKKGQLAEDK